MSVGIVTFFKYTECGFYRVGSDYNEPLEMSVMLESLLEWHQKRVSLEDTLLWDDETPGYALRKKVYLKSIDKDERTGDYMVFLWRAVGSGDGVYGMKASARLDDENLYDANEAVGEERVIWGEGAYYWFIPNQNLFASIRFPNTITDTNMMNAYLKDYIKLHADIKQKVREVREGKSGTFTSVSFPAQEEGESGNLWLRIWSKQYTKITTQADLGAIARDITHFVKREVISAREEQQPDWTRLFGGLPFVSSEVKKETRNVEINIEAKPTAEELQLVFAEYEAQYNGGLDGWRNIGFRKEGVGGVCWLNSFAVKNTLSIDDIVADGTGHYSTQRLLMALELKRDNLLAPFIAVEEVKEADQVERVG